MEVGTRVMESWAASVKTMEAREASGQQPSLPFTSITHLVYANVFYLGLTFVLYVCMKYKKEPFKCGMFKQILLVYNFSCVCLAGYVVLGIVNSHLARPFKFVCNPTQIPAAGSDGSGQADQLAFVFWIFYIQKFWEFLDTWFFILRKSFRQVTFLHIFHHCSINIVVGVIVPHDFNGDMYLPILLNAFVHVLMYAHYLVAALGMKTWWKPYLTSMQLAQFCLIATQSAISLSRGDSCGAPYFAKVVMVSYMGSMLALFGNFFVHSYILKKPDSKFGGGVIKKPEAIQMTKVHTGRATFDDKGNCEVELPSSYSGGQLHYNVMPIGAPMPQLHVAREPLAGGNSFLLAGALPKSTATWVVTEVKTLLGPKKPEPNPTLLSCCSRVEDLQGNTQDPQSNGTSKKSQ